MATGIALLRGINVGGHGVLPMRELAALLQGLGLEDVRTYLQSGNAVFRHPGAEAAELAARIRGEIFRRHGLDPAVLVLDVAELETVVRDNPFPEAADQPKSLHASFLWSPPPSPDLDRLEGVRRASERFALRGRVLYLHAPEGIGRSKLAAAAERLLGVAMTGRNWRSVTGILDLARAVALADGGGRPPGTGR